MLATHSFVCLPSSCRLLLSELEQAIQTMDSFVATCLPEVGAQWWVSSREVLQAGSTRAINPDAKRTSSALLHPQPPSEGPATSLPPCNNTPPPRHINDRLAFPYYEGGIKFGATEHEKCVQDRWLKELGSGFETWRAVFRVACKNVQTEELASSFDKLRAWRRSQPPWNVDSFGHVTVVVITDSHSN